jgi:hypothetical protein
MNLEKKRDLFMLILNVLKKENVPEEKYSPNTHA